ncbi:Fe-S cluster assembly sulfur transfer protein SufU [Alicyclobacillus sp. SO9]|uniref:Fe-S cluster assembly sulfur transfer protein SufU n=1 Tax=Alicyclobacillus sp. SO9 TaxID=2665646 RepID=UPI0018E79FDD|nr:SUF system NifU family Fe-S cluster assembly protein [Alicyclobacillus sp. SO9]QQE80288.1 SUF system NifU family Fe-S cluster assembly protein [Alicyclobacillus sp. SO9]
MQLDDLYRQVIMDHYQHPRNSGKIDEGTVDVDMRNPSCGDEITLQLLVKDGVIQDVKFLGSGCSISISSASMMTEAVMGKTVEEALQMQELFRQMVKGEDIDAEELGDLESLQGVSKFPARFKCATLGWQALEKALQKQEADA